MFRLSVSAYSPTRNINKKYFNSQSKNIFSIIDLRVGEIISCSDHPNADSLFVEDIKIGPNESRQIISGLKGQFTPEELIGKKCAVVCNLKSSKFRRMKVLV